MRLETGMLFQKKVKQERPRPDRIKNLDEVQIRGWMNACLMELGATYDQWAYHKASPDEFSKVLDLVKDLWDELQSRTDK
jgi:hypothetical protein